MWKIIIRVIRRRENKKLQRTSLHLDAQVGCVEKMLGKKN